VEVLWLGGVPAWKAERASERVVDRQGDCGTCLSSPFKACKMVPGKKGRTELAGPPFPLRSCRRMAQKSGQMQPEWDYWV
jgi:hypothetical protein